MATARSTSGVGGVAARVAAWRCLTSGESLSVLTTRTWLQPKSFLSYRAFEMSASATIVE